MYNIRRY